MVSLFRQIIQHNPDIQVLNMKYFSEYSDRDENIGELILEALLNSNIESINDLNLFFNPSWFRHPETKKEKSSNVVLLVELISKQVGLQHLNLGGNYFTSNAT